MYNSKLISILKSFDQPEWKDFRCYLLYKNPRNPKILHLYDYIRKYKNNIKSKKLDIEEARTSIPLGLMTRKNFQNAMSRLSIIVEEYLVVQSVLSDKIETDYRLFQNYNDRNLFSLANNKVKSVTDRWNNSEELDLIKINYILKIQHSQYFSENPIKYEKGNLVALKNILKSFNDFNFIYSEFYRYAIESTSSRTQYDPKEFETMGQSDKFITNEISKILVNLNKLRKTNDQVSFQYLFEKLQSNNKMSSDLKVMIFGECEAFLTNIIMKGQSEINANTILNLYQLGISSGILLYKNALSIVTFHNILSTACFLEEFDWADEYVKNYINLVPLKEREESLIFANIKIHFGKWEYEKALTLLTTSELNNFGLKVQSRWYSLVIYYITFDNIDFLDSQISNFNQFFYYNKKRVSFRNFDGSLNLAKIFRSAVNYGKQFDLEAEKEKYENIIFKNRLESIFEQREIYKNNNDIDL